MDSIAWLEIFRSFTLVEMLSKIIMPSRYLINKLHLRLSLIREPVSHGVSVWGRVRGVTAILRKKSQPMKQCGPTQRRRRQDVSFAPFTSRQGTLRRTALQLFIYWSD
jgi:hypothetical protein